MNWNKFDNYVAKLGVFYFFLITTLITGGLILIVIVEPIYNCFSIEKEVKYKCFKYVNYEHENYVLFEDLKDLKRFYFNNPNACINDFSMKNKNGILVKKGTITVELLDDNIDSLFVKIEYRPFIIKREYYTLNCYIDKYAPEYFNF